MKKYTAYCVSKRKKVTIKKIKQVWKAKSRNHYLYLLEGEAPGCDTSVWRAVGEDEAHKVAKHIGKPIKLRKSSGKKKRAASKKRKSTRKGMVRKTARRAYMGLKKKKKKRATSKSRKRKAPKRKKSRARSKSRRRR